MAERRTIEFTWLVLESSHVDFDEFSTNGVSNVQNVISTVDEVLSKHEVAMGCKINWNVEYFPPFAEGHNEKMTTVGRTRAFEMCESQYTPQFVIKEHSEHAVYFVISYCVAWIICVIAFER